jgi:hypothetical protein
MANLLFIGSWRRLFFPFGEAYHLKLEPYSMDYLGLLLNVLLTAVFFILSVVLLRYFLDERASIVLKTFFLLSGALVLNNFRHQIYELSPNSFNYVNPIILIVILAFVILSFFKWHNYLFDVLRRLSLILSPLLILTFAFAAWELIKPHPEDETPMENQLSAIRPQEKPELKNRVIWIIFDELDYAVPFEKHPVPLPEFEKLKESSIFATQALPPAYTTRDATASLLTGKKVEASEPLAKDELSLKFSNAGTAEKFSETTNILRRVRSLKGETAIVGWLHPYGRVLRQDLSACRWFSVDTYRDFERQKLHQIIFHNFQSLLVSLPFGARIESWLDKKLKESIVDKSYLKRHLEMMKATNSAITDPNVDLAFIHLPFPHPPNYYEAEKGDFSSPLTKATNRQNTYFDNLALTDKMLGEIRQNLENADLWDNSTIIVSSDHQWRVNIYKDEMDQKEIQMTGGKEDGRVPFFLKLKGQKDSFIYEKPFNTVITQALILALMKGEISTIEEISGWLDKNFDR